MSKGCDAKRWATLSIPKQIPPEVSPKLTFDYLILNSQWVPQDLFGEYYSIFFFFFSVIGLGSTAHV